MAVLRRDFAFPFRIDPASRRGTNTSYPAHVAQMVRQVLLTTPGERVDLPEFGCGLRALIFAPISDGLAAMTELLVQQSLERWLADHIAVRSVEVLPPSQSNAENELRIAVEYVLLGSGVTQRVELEVI
jgi:phage baseplate assembly protein W